MFRQSAHGGGTLAHADVAVCKSSQAVRAALLNGGDDNFSRFAGRTVICSQIAARLLRFDLCQYQRSAAFGTRRPKIVDKLKIKGVFHLPAREHFIRLNSQSILFPVLDLYFFGQSLNGIHRATPRRA
jgi:hypothetical protein